ncbi:carbonic anhydrase [Ceratobasidium sp. AG-Ba]|nr:carbonic anhydrase [Ceratobasidium sp. AG-Ba]
MTTPKVAAEFAAANESYVKNYGGKLPIPPSRQPLASYFIEVYTITKINLSPSLPMKVTCMDARIDPIASLGLKEGEAHVIRNAGGRASEAIRSIVISQRLLGTTEVVIFHHTDCGMLTFTDKEIRDKIKTTDGPSTAPYVDQIAFLPFDSVEKSVEEDVQFVKSHPLLLKDAKVSGWVHEVETGRIRQVV